MIPKISKKNELVIRYTLTEEEYLEASQPASYFRMLFNNLIFMGAVLLVMYLMDVPITYSKMITIFGLQVCIVIFFKFYARRVQKNFFQHNEILQNEVRLKFLDLGMHYDYATGDGFVEWSHFQSYRCNKKYCFLYADPTVIIIPLKTLTIEERAQFLYFMKKHLVDQQQWYDDEEDEDEALLDKVWSEKNKKDNKKDKED